MPEVKKRPVDPTIKHSKMTPTLTVSEAETASVVKIQSVWRGKLERDKFRTKLDGYHSARQARFDAADLFDAALVIQRLVRMIRAKRAARQTLEVRRSANNRSSSVGDMKVLNVGKSASPVRLLKPESGGGSPTTPNRAAGSALSYITEKRSPLNGSPKGSDQKYKVILAQVPDRLLRLSHPPQDEELLRLFQALEEAEVAVHAGNSSEGAVSEQSCCEVYYRFGGEVMLLKGETIESSVRGMLAKIVRPTASQSPTKSESIAINFDQFCRFMLKVVPQ